MSSSDIYDFATATGMNSSSQSLRISQEGYASSHFRMTCVWIGPLKDTRRARFLNIRRWREVIAAAFGIGGHLSEVIVNLRRAASDRYQRNFWHEGAFESLLKDDVVVVTTC